MALSYGFFNAELTQSGQYDRVYAAEQFAEYFHLIVSNGVFPDPATQLQVVASNTPDMNVNVSDGYGWINGYFAKNSGSYPLAIQAASGTLNRVDAVVLRWVNASRSMELAVKTGIAASSPAIPALQRDNDVYELMLATVTVAAGATSIPQSAITDKRADTSVCGWMTGAVQNIDTTNLFAQYNDAFQVWFADIRAQLSGDVATNLQNQINQLKGNKVNVSDKANTAQAQTGTDDTKWMSPLKVKQAFDSFISGHVYMKQLIDAKPAGASAFSYETEEALSDFDFILVSAILSSTGYKEYPVFKLSLGTNKAKILEIVASGSSGTSTSTTSAYYGSVFAVAPIPKNTNPVPLGKIYKYDGYSFTSGSDTEVETFEGSVETAVTPVGTGIHLEGDTALQSISKRPYQMLKIWGVKIL